jgi:hypothetical protein
VVASSSPRRRARFRSNPANFIFTLFDMALMFHWRRLTGRLICFSRKHAMVVFCLTKLSEPLKALKGALGGWKICLSVGLLCP